MWLYSTGNDPLQYHDHALVSVSVFSQRGTPLYSQENCTTISLMLALMAGTFSKNICFYPGFTQAGDGPCSLANKELIYVFLMHGHPLLLVSDWWMIIPTCLHVKSLIGFVVMAQ